MISPVPFLESVEQLSQAITELDQLPPREAIASIVVECRKVAEAGELWLAGVDAA